MAVLIKNMDIPESCSSCRLRQDGWCYAIPEGEIQPGNTRPDRRPDWCRLVEVSAHKAPDYKLLEDAGLEL